MNMKKTIRAMSMAVLVGCSLPAHAMTPVQITSNGSSDAEPQIHGEQLVWQGTINNNWEIFYHDISTGITTQLTNNTVDDMFPQTDGNYVAWLGDGMNGALKYYTIATGVTVVIPEDAGDFIKSAPQVANGNITWAASSVTASVDPGEVYLYNIASGVTTNISALTDPTNQLEDVGPSINDSLVGWLQIDDLGNDDPEDDVETFMLYNIGNATAAAAPLDFIWTDSPQSDGDLSVLTKNDGNDSEIFLQRGRASYQVTDNTINDSWPCISGTTIAWVSGSDEAAEIYIATDTDVDGDGVTDSFDNCVNTSNSDQLDTNNDGVGDVCEESLLGRGHITNTVIRFECATCHPDGLAADKKPCIDCHKNSDSNTYNAMDTIAMSTHSSELTSEKYGVWAKECVDCHDPHSPNGMNIYDGILDDSYVLVDLIAKDAVTDPATLTTTFDIEDVNIYEPAWAAPGTWGEKTSLERGLLFVWYNPILGKYYWIEVSSATATTITINDPDFPRIPKFNPDPILAKLVYGNLINDEVNQTPVKFGGPATMAYDESGTGVDPTPNGICQVCHTQTNFWRNDGTEGVGGTTHYNGEDCTECHLHENGFKAPGP